jgi:hypothetical protein
VSADVVYATAVFVAVRRLPGRLVPLHLSFLARLAVGVAAAAAVGVLVPASDAVAASLAAAVFAAACVIQRMVPVDVWSAIPRTNRA